MCTKVLYYELWGDNGEACMFSPDDNTKPKTYHLMTHNVHNKPMTLLASFKSTYPESKIIYNDVLGF